MRSARLSLFLFFVAPFCLSGADMAAAHFRENIQPILTRYCYDCHADGANKGNVAFDEFKTDSDIVTNSRLWLAVLNNVRAGLMPPEKKERPTAGEQKILADWIKFDAFAINTNHLDAGRPTIRRLNRSEYHNTIHDLLGVDYDTREEFPADDTGFGFDDIGDVLTLSPMLMEKYVNAAQTIITEAVPLESRVVGEHALPTHKLTPLSYYHASIQTNGFDISQSGRFTLALNLAAQEKYVDGKFDSNRCRFILSLDGHGFVDQEFNREENKRFRFEITTNLAAGKHELTMEVQPLTPGGQEVRSLALRVQSTSLRGPLDEKFWVQPKNYRRFFPRDVPPGELEREAYARELLGNFASRAFRHPVEPGMLDRLTALAKKFYQQRGNTFEAGVAHAMVAVLASPDFLFLEEGPVNGHASDRQQPVGEYALASRLSYFLWSSMPDQELFDLAKAGTLRRNLATQVQRMMADPRSHGFVEDFTGQWLQARDVETVIIEAREVLARESKPDAEHEKFRARLHELNNKPEKTLTAEERAELGRLHADIPKHFMPPRVDLSMDLRQSMRHEVEKYFEGIIREDGSVNDLVDSDYTYLNERLATHYGLTNLNITGPELRRVRLPADSPRGGVLTMGAVLTVTSNPTRTSPVKRGLFVLDNILGTPTPPPPPNIPPLEDAEKKAADHEATLREALEIHRNKPLCASCHKRMDPLGLAFENFNALGMWRSQEHNQEIKVDGKLITGESFQDIRELKHVLITKHQTDFYRTVTQKMLTYALGRGLEYYDMETVDRIVDRLQRENGRFSVLLNGIIESTPFQERRNMQVAMKDEKNLTASK